MDNQEEFWISQFGDEYTDRNNDFLIKNNINLFEKILNSRHDKHNQHFYHCYYCLNHFNFTTNYY
jgi:hypothetical protein